MSVKKIIYFAIISTCVGALVDAQIYVNGSILSDREYLCTMGSGPQCSEDCSSLLLCAAGQTNPFEVINCAKSTPSTPYCYGNTCSKSPGDCVTSSSFRCTSKGVFPDPNNCSRYRLCHESNGESTLLECPEGYIFNSKINLCEVGKSAHSKVCNKVDCSHKINDVVVYKSNAAYFAFCYVDSSVGRRETIMFKCESEHEIYDPSENMCKFNCKSAGHYPDPTDCNSYYVCVVVSFGTYKSQRFQCPPTYVFDGKRCTKDSSECVESSK